MYLFLCTGSVVDIFLSPLCHMFQVFYNENAFLQKHLNTLFLLKILNLQTWREGPGSDWALLSGPRNPRAPGLLTLIPAKV